MNSNIQLMKVIVGSQAHGLATPDSDWDFKYVYALPTKDLLSINPPQHQKEWSEGDKDDTVGWEIGHFLFLAMKSNPTILEVFNAPIIERSIFTDSLRDLFPYVWDSRAAHAAFQGYGRNQRTKLLKCGDGQIPEFRAGKYAQAWLRVLYQGTELFKTGIMPVDMRESPIYTTLQAWREPDCGGWSVGFMLDLCKAWERIMSEEFEKNSLKRPDIEKVNGYLLDLRRQLWDG